MNRSRIIGYIDVENEKFISSPYYEKIQTYNKNYKIIPDNHNSQRGYLKIENILYWIKTFEDYGNYLEIDDSRKYDGIKENFFLAASEQIKDNIEYIEKRLEEDCITKEEYNNSLNNYTPVIEDDMGLGDFDSSNWDNLDFSSWEDYNEINNNPKTK